MKTQIVTRFGSNPIEEYIQARLGRNYTWDAELEELQYRGHPIAFYITDYEARVVTEARTRQAMELVHKFESGQK